MIYSAPRLDREATPHWKAAARGRLVMPFCADCGRSAWPPSRSCKACGSALVWKECSGEGAVASYSVVRRAVQPEWKEAAPYVVAIIELDEGPMLLSNVVDCEPARLHCGMRVQCRFVETTDPEIRLPVFFPCAGGVAAPAATAPRS